MGHLYHRKPEKKYETRLSESSTAHREGTMVLAVVITVITGMSSPYILHLRTAEKEDAEK